MGPLLIFTYFRLLNKEFKNKKMAAVPVIYGPILTGILYSNSMLGFLICFYFIIKAAKDENFENFAMLSIISLIFRPDGIFLLGLAALKLIKNKKKELFVSFMKIGGSLLIYGIINLLLFGNPLYPVVLNSHSTQVFDFSLLLSRIINEPVTAASTLLTLPFIFYFIIKKGVFRPYYLFLLLFGFLNPQMLFEIGRWGGSSALLLFMFENKKIIKKYINTILTIEGMHTFIYLFVKIRFIISQIGI